MTDFKKRYWTAFYTKPRNERKVNERLSGLGYETFFPTKTVLKQWSDRRKKVKEPLFTSYIFVFVNEVVRQEVLKDSGVINSVFWLGKPVVIRNQEIQAIKDFTNQHSDLKVFSDLYEGKRVEIVEGPLKGQIGELNKIKRNKIILTIESLGYTLVAEVAKSKVSVANEA